VIKLKILLEQIIKEVGDLDNIPSYKFQKLNPTNYTFSDIDNDDVLVSFNKHDSNEVEQLIGDNSKVDRSLIYNVVYKIKKEESQYKQTGYKELIKIIKTIYEIIKEFINDKQPTGLTFFAANKNSDFILSKTDPQKGMLYKSILLKNIQNFPGWSYLDSDLDSDFKGFLMYKK
jgi:hypothetical protein